MVYTHALLESCQVLRSPYQARNEYINTTEALLTRFYTLQLTAYSVPPEKSYRLLLSMFKYSSQLRWLA